MTKTAKYQVRTTTANGLARWENATKATAWKIAAERSMLHDNIESDVLIDGEFATAFIDGVQVIW